MNIKKITLIFLTQSSTGHLVTLTFKGQVTIKIYSQSEDLSTKRS